MPHSHMSRMRVEGRRPNHSYCYHSTDPPLPPSLPRTYPMVVINVGEKESLAYRSSRHVFPTPESPIISSLICMSKGFSCRAIFENGACGVWFG